MVVYTDIGVVDSGKPQGKNMDSETTRLGRIESYMEKRERADNYFSYIPLQINSQHTLEHKIVRGDNGITNNRCVQESVSYRTLKFVSAIFHAILNPPGMLSVMELK
ncbi:unnamed protein product [Allacma fusca]|uniref:Uncharacterized protein n=1 Tax=Allacma fusca TaxID=39272 RepID=A0A8J2LFC6_9HEXA|nr:unnamed protein product [Allacma fusca]